MANTFDILVEGFGDYCSKNDCKSCDLRECDPCTLAYASAILNRVCEHYEGDINNGKE